MLVTARIKLKTSSLDNKPQDTENRSRRENPRFLKVLVRLVNAREDADLRSIVKASLDLMPPGAEKIDWKAALSEQGETARAALMQIALAQSKLRAAWKLPHGAFQKFILIELAGDCIRRHFGPALERVTLITGQFEDPHFHPSLRSTDAARKVNSELLRGPQFPFMIFAALHAAPQMRVCHYRGCPHPFYLRSEGGKQFCSKACAKPTSDNAKLRWWNAHKKELLAQRREKRKRSKRASRRKTQQRGKRQ